MSRFVALLALALVASLGAGCHVTINEPSTIPGATQLYFPAGILRDPDASLLYVTNGNSDLRYGGGTVQVVDLVRFECALSAAQGAAVDPVACPTAQADAAACVPDPLDPSVLDCDQTAFLFAEATVKVGNFAGGMVMQRLTDPNDPTNTNLRRLFVSVRGDPSITWIDVDVSKAVGQGRLILDCFDPGTRANILANPPTDPKTGNVAPVGCDASHLVQQFLCVGQPFCQPGDNPPNTVIPAEPFAIAYDEGPRDDGSTYHRVVATHLSPGQVSVIDTDGTPFVQSVSPQFFSPDGAGRRGAFDVAARTPGVDKGLWYTTSTAVPRIQTFRIADPGQVVSGETVNLSGLFAANVDYRAIVFEPGGDRAFVTLGAPPSMVVLDTRILPNADRPGVPANTPVDAVPICQGPSNLVLRPTLVPGADGAPPYVQSRLYAVCFANGQIMEIDPDHPRVLETIATGRGPNQLVFEDDAATTPTHRAYVSNFSESTIGVIDFDPGSPTEKRMIGRLGIPTAPPATF